MSSGLTDTNHDQIRRQTGRWMTLFSPKTGPILALLLLLLPPPVFGQLLREPQTPYHFLRYDDVPSDQQSPTWPKDFWAPIKFIPLPILPGSYLNFGGELRERVEHFSHPF